MRRAGGSRHRRVRCGRSCSAAPATTSARAPTGSPATRAGGPRPRTGSIQRRTPLQAHRLIELLIEVQLPVVCAVTRAGPPASGARSRSPPTSRSPPSRAASGSRSSSAGSAPTAGRRGCCPGSSAWPGPRSCSCSAASCPGREAADWGLIHRAVPDAELDAAVDELVAELRQRADRRRRPHQALHPPARLEGSLAEAMEAESNALELSSRTARLQGGPRRLPREPARPEFEGSVERERLQPWSFETIRLRGQRPRRHDHAEPPRPAERAEPGDDRRAAPGLRRGRGRRRGVDPARHRDRPGVLHRRRRRRDPRRRPGRLRRAVPLDLRRSGRRRRRARRRSAR